MKFWAGGSGSYLNHLKQEEKERLSELKKALDSETDLERKKSIRSQMKAVRDEYKDKKKNAEKSLFGHVS